MALPLNLLFNQVSKAIQNHSSDQTPGPSYNANPLLGALQGMFGQYANQSGQQFNRQPDYDNGEEYQQNYGPLGGLADMFGGGQQNQPQMGQNQGFGNVLPASQDPYGDPADQQAGGNQGGQFGNILPASQDPYGDPADQERR